LCTEVIYLFFVQINKMLMCKPFRGGFCIGNAYRGDIFGRTMVNVDMPDCSEISTIYIIRSFLSVSHMAVFYKL